MSSAPESELTEDGFLEAVSAIRFIAPDLSPIGAAMLAAIHFDIANDSRAFSLKLGVEHALTLREVTALSSPELGLLNIVSRSERTQRTHFALTDKSNQLIARAFASN
ncbi:hypothetical protein [Hyphomicrobium sp. MC8b]|uniref:hypothetical protein n=1 Tax=Hyphomicrobium sp. MC8b TaxID=300273 RepID=UPI00391C57EE